MERFLPLRKQEKRWTEHFKEILNRPPLTQEGNIPSAASNLNINLEPPSTLEINLAIKFLKNNKAPGHENLNAEIFKADPILANKKKD